MRKSSILLIAASSIVGLSGCNKQIFDVNYNFDKVHLKSLNECFEISSWNDYEGDMIQVTLKANSTVMVVSDVEATLICGTCPYCGHE